MEAISNHFGGEMLVLSCTGLASVLVICTHASQLVQLVEETDDDCSHKDCQGAKSHH